MNAKLILGDCLEVMKDIPDASVDMVLADLPYGTTACKWDTVLDLAVLWAQYERVAKENAAIVLFGAQPFTSALVMSRPELFKYQWVWNKVKASGHLNAKRRPMQQHEDVLVFSRGTPAYNPQGLVYGEFSNVRPAHGKKDDTTYGSQVNDFGTAKAGNYPKSIIEFSKPNDRERVHPTQKPVALLEYLIKTYTNEGETVLDNTMGSGSTGVACANTGRKFIGIEKEPKYFEIAEKRIFNSFPPFVKQQSEPKRWCEHMGGLGPPFPLCEKCRADI